MQCIRRISSQHQAFADSIREHPRVREVRCRGTIIAMEWDTGADSSYFSSLRDQLYDFFLKKGIILRPLGNISYIMPRSEEHTSELQSLMRISYAVFCLKKTK